ncbi:ligand-gated channel [Rhodanobacter thiooxydans]|uniref:Ligand-gated channel n=1 Tax=Rhodanobacter thiooxydans TaxID=416169 RepID=A0A154QKX5_9GAMM|nr:TonB-dependent receptor [Rhodanobacter thiooxydans]EIL97252.1 outer membrane hemin receptor [Rhodanobacter thiooxydans LCS2]KZC24672.1 ligand-gated channel [Rhodanobacter thiooxydans]MCW0202794.1 TonB-dependent receptor [Rhodanobacter thiooxydans]
MRKTLLAFSLAALFGTAWPDLASASAPATDAIPDEDTAKGKPVQNLQDIVVTAVPLGLGIDQIVRPAAVLAGAQLDALKGISLGETVSNIPGVQSAGMGAAVGRPVIRGFDGPRVAVLENGLSSQDVSNVSQDHAVTLEPFLADQIEVLKGPSTLLYGSGAIGGAVNVVDGRIPEKAPDDGFAGRAEARYDSVSEGKTGMFRVDGGNDDFALHVDGMRRDNDSYDIPGGTLANSQVKTTAGSVGASMLGNWGYLGLSVARFMDAYGSPAEPGDPALGEDPVTIKMAQTNYTLKGGLVDPFAGISKIDFSLGHGAYQHVEYEGSEAGTTFGTDSNQGRLIVSHQPIAGWEGAIGVQTGHRRFSAVGDETFVPATTTKSVGVFVMEQRDFGPVKLELGARHDKQSSEPEYGGKRSFSPSSFSAGAAWRFTEHWHLSLNLNRAQRAPAEEELFSNGPHAASATFEIGDADLGKETSNQAELGLHFHGEKVEGKVAVYYNRYRNFIYLADTGDINDGLPVRLWSQDDANFRGAEAEATFHLARGVHGNWDLRVFGDTVRATLANGGRNLPRIPASRAGAQVNWSADELRASLGAVRYFKQDKTAPFETETAGYTLVNAHLAWTFHDHANSQWEAFLDGNNLTNQTARPATSLFKDSAPMPGRNISVGLRAFF